RRWGSRRRRCRCGRSSSFARRTEMRADEIREMSASDIRGKIQELEEEQFRLNFRAGTETLEDPLRLRVIRRDIARLKTVLREQQHPASASAGAAGSKASASAPAASKGDQQKTAKKSARKTAGSARR